MIGITHHVSMAPPVRRKSTRFIAASIPSIEIKDIPMATLNASLRTICLERIIVSRIIEVVIPLNIANIIMLIVDQPESVKMNWNAAIVPRSPIEHPIKHHMVLYADLPQTSLSDQLNSENSTSLGSESQHELRPSPPDMTDGLAMGF